MRAAMLPDRAPVNNVQRTLYCCVHTNTLCYQGQVVTSLTLAVRINESCDVSFRPTQVLQQSLLLTSHYHSTLS